MSFSRQWPALQGNKHQRGAGFIEMLVSLLILGVGLLGVLSLQANGSSSNQRAVFVTEAHLLAQDMGDRIRSFGDNGLGARAGQYGATDTLDKNGALVYAEQLCNDPCDANATVAYDRYEWESAIDASSLPSGRGKVIFDNGSNQYIVRVFWDQDRTGAAGVITDAQNCNDPERMRNKSADGNLTCYDLPISLYRDDP